MRWLQGWMSMGLVAGICWTLVGPPALRAASHSDAPLIKQDPQANITDVYAFVGTKYDDANEQVLNVIVHVRPMSVPGDGPHYERFADDALYSIHITNPTTGATVIRYDFQFSDVNPLSNPGLKNPNTLLSFGRGTEVGAIGGIDDARRNYTQTFAVRKNGAPMGTGITPPPNVGARTTPLYNDPGTGFAVSGATSLAELDTYTRSGISELSGGEAVFAGSREDGFFLDIAGLMDLLDPRIIGASFGQAGGGVDGFKGFNVLAYAIQIPLASLNNVPEFPKVGVYASVSRQRVRVLRNNGDPVGSGPWIQVNRMGNPLFNEGFVALKDKDNYNRMSPADDVARFKTYAENPELAVLINAVFGTSIPSTGRSDLAAIFIPDVLRIQTDAGPVPLAGQAGFSRLSFIGGDLTNDVPSGFPNGRRLGDDVVDIALTALAAGTIPGDLLGDNVHANDQVYHQVFPYSATPHAGTQVRFDP